MDSPQSVVSPLVNNPIFVGSEKQSFDLFLKNDGSCASDGRFLGVLDVYVHQARDIHNICIYQKQDVYAKFCFTSNPENTVSTKIINGGGANPVFNEKIKLDVQSFESSLKCEIWMLSRVRNYLEDQLLGFTLVPLAEVLKKNGQIEGEFSLSSTDLFHSPAGFVQLSISYVGATPDVILRPPHLTSRAAAAEIGVDKLPEFVPSELEKIEFPDPDVAKANQLMVSEYFEISSGSLAVSEITEFADSIGNSDSGPIEKQDSPPSSISINGPPASSLPISCQVSENPTASATPDRDQFSPVKKSPENHPKEKNTKEIRDDGKSDDAFGELAKPVVTVNFEPEQKVVQQDFVDLYMKSMQQFTESLAKMKLPMDMEGGEPTSSGSTSSDQKTTTPNSSSSRVFYGSRAFF